MMHSWHDFHIVGYAVNGKGQEVSFDLEWPYESGSLVRRAKLRFLGVEGYFLEHDMGGNIVFDFSERPLSEFLQEWTERFEASCRWGWPKFWRLQPYPARPLAVEVEDAQRWLVAKGIKCIELSSSYGLSGWILASGVQHEVQDAWPCPAMSRRS